MATLETSTSVPGGLLGVLQRLAPLSGADVSGGIQRLDADDAKRERKPDGSEDVSDAELVTVAAAMEFGTDTGVPQRAYMRPALDEAGPALRTEFGRRLFKAAKEGTPPENAGLVVAEKLATAIRDKIRSHPGDLLSEAYATRMGVPRSETLIRTGQLRGSIRGAFEWRGRVTLGGKE